MNKCVQTMILEDEWLVCFMCWLGCGRHFQNIYEGLWQRWRIVTGSDSAVSEVSRNAGPVSLTICLTVSALAKLVYFLKEQ